MFESSDNIGWNLLALHQVTTTRVGIKHHIEFIRGTIADRGNDVGVHHIVNEWNVLVTDSLNVVFTETILKHGRALKCFNRNNLCSVMIFESIACTNGASGSGGGCESRKAQIRIALQHVFKY